MDPYEALGVPRAATPAEVRRAWQRRLRALHPALNPGDPVAAERFGEARRAFEILSDPQRRAAYDRGERPPVPVAPAPEAGFEGFDFSAAMRVESVGFREIFDSARREEGEGRGPSPGEDIEQSTRITFEESMTGAQRRVHLVRFETCPVCEGRGEVTFGPVPCPRCQGQGQVRGSRGHMIFSRPCSDCDGTGSLRRETCARCSGEGRLIVSEWLEVRIPAGVGDGSQVRLAGAGNAGRRCGSAGDFVLTVEVEPHALFRREGEDLHCLISVGMVDAALGGHVPVQTPDGTVTIELPAGTQNGQRFRLRKRGVPRLGGGSRGDLWAEVRVVIPAVTDDRARALLQEVRSLASVPPATDGETAHGRPSFRS